MNAVQRRTLTVPLDFLEPGKAYEAHIYSDAVPDGGEPFEVRIEKRTVNAGEVLQADCASNGGQAVHIVPVD
jgi:alpha-glucosidase